MCFCVISDTKKYVFYAINLAVADIADWIKLFCDSTGVY